MSNNFRVNDLKKGATTKSIKEIKEEHGEAIAALINFKYLSIVDKTKIEETIDKILNEYEKELVVE